MKKHLSLIVAAIGALLLLDSCSYKVYDPILLEQNFAKKIVSQNEIVAKQNIRIFYSDLEVPTPYEVIDLVEYHPIIQIPIFYGEYTQQKKKFLYKAVMKADELGGNGLIVTAVSQFKVIKMEGASRISKKTVLNPILDMELAETFATNKYDGLKSSKQREQVARLQEQIESNLKKAQTYEEVDAISAKVDILEKFNAGVAKPDNSVVKAIKGYRAEMKGIEQKIKSKAKFQEKKANAMNKLQEAKDKAAENRSAKKAASDAVLDEQK